MRFDTVIELIKVTYTQDELGQQIATKTRRTVYANEFNLGTRYSEGATEFSEGGAQGLKLRHQYQIRREDYAGEALCDIGDEEFNIVRADPRGQWIRLLCERELGDG